MSEWRQSRLGKWWLLLLMPEKNSHHIVWTSLAEAIQESGTWEFQVYPSVQGFQDNWNSTRCWSWHWVLTSFSNRLLEVCRYILNICLFLFYVCVCLLVCTCHKATKLYDPWKWSYRHLGATIWGLGREPGPAGWEASDQNHRAVVRRVACWFRAPQPA